MSKHSVRLAVLLFVSVAAFAADKPELAFDGRSVAVRGVEPGGRTAWMALVRERVQNHTSVRVYRGLTPAAANGVADISGAAAEAPRALWIVADVGRGKGVRGAPPAVTPSPVAVPIRAAVGQPTITIEAAEAHVLYVHPPSGAWALEVSDGSDRDADGAADGTITIALSSLHALQGRVKPPDQTETGDLILAIDPRRVRSGEAVVQ
jgi:hypothetical protein